MITAVVVIVDHVPDINFTSCVFHTVQKVSQRLRKSPELFGKELLGKRNTRLDPNEPGSCLLVHSAVDHSIIITLYKLCHFEKSTCIVMYILF